jgi:hypothetical protein
MPHIVYTSLPEEKRYTGFILFSDDDFREYMEMIEETIKEQGSISGYFIEDEDGAELSEPMVEIETIDEFFDMCIYEPVSDEQATVIENTIGTAFGNPLYFIADEE